MNNGQSPAHPTGNSQSSIGLTKREYFAGLAMQGYLASFNSTELANAESMAAKCVKYADALLAELEKTQP